MSFVLNVLIFSLLWYLWVVRIKHLTQMGEKIPCVECYHRFLNKEDYWVKLVMGFLCSAVILDFGVKVVKFYEFFYFTGLPHGY